MESKLLVTDKSVVVPGQVLAVGMDYFPGLGTYRHEEQILANQLGLIQIDGKVLKTQPLAGKYLPAKNDVVIGKVTDVLMSGWRFEINSPYSAVLPLKDATSDFIRKGEDLTEYFDLNDQVVCKITQVTSQNLIDVSMKGPGLRKLRGGQFLSITPPKIPRLIGRRASMVSMIAAATGCDIVVGQNGVVWISGDPAMEVIVAQAIAKIEREAHVSGLTERVKSFLEDRTGKPIDMAAVERESQAREQASSDVRREAPRRDFERREGGDGDGERREFNGPRRDGNDRRDSFRGPRRDGPRNDGPRPPREDSFRAPRRDDQ